MAIAASVLPSIVAFTRRHHHALAIFVLNLLSGVPFGYFMLIRSELESAKMQMLLVAFLMWSAAMVWACTNSKGYFARVQVEQSRRTGSNVAE